MTTIMKTIKSLPGLKITDFEDRSLLIVDDDDPLRMRLSRAMEKKGFQVKDAKTVENAIKMVASNPPKFALVDLRLEDGNGLDVVKEINAQQGKQFDPKLIDVFNQRIKEIEDVLVRYPD